MYFHTVNKLLKLQVQKLFNFFNSVFIVKKYGGNVVSCWAVTVGQSITEIYSINNY